MGGHLAQRGDGALELRQRRRVFLRDDEIDLVREAGHRVVEADQVFRRRQSAQGVAHFGKAVLDAAERAGVDAGLAAFRDALVEALDLLFDGVDGAARHRVVERAADLAELLAQRIDRLFDARLAQRLDLIGDLAKLIFQTRQVLRRQWHGRRRGVGAGAGTAIAACGCCRGGAALPLSTRWRAAISATARSRLGGNCTLGIAGGIIGGGGGGRDTLANWSSRRSRRPISSASWSGSLRLRFGA